MHCGILGLFIDACVTPCHDTLSVVRESSWPHVLECYKTMGVCLRNTRELCVCGRGSWNRVRWTRVLTAAWRGRVATGRGKVWNFHTRCRRRLRYGVLASVCVFSYKKSFQVLDAGNLARIISCRNQPLLDSTCEASRCQSFLFLLTFVLTFNICVLWCLVVLQYIFQYFLIFLLLFSFASTNLFQSFLPFVVSFAHQSC